MPRIRPPTSLLCGRGCGSQFRNPAPLSRHEAVCTYKRNTPAPPSPIAKYVTSLNKGGKEFEHGKDKSLGEKEIKKETL